MKLEFRDYRSMFKNFDQSVGLLIGYKIGSFESAVESMNKMNRLVAVCFFFFF